MGDAAQIPHRRYGSARQTLFRSCTAEVVSFQRIEKIGLGGNKIAAGGGGDARLQCGLRRLTVAMKPPPFGRTPGHCLDRGFSWMRIPVVAVLLRTFSISRGPKFSDSVC